MMDYNISSFSSFGVEKQKSPERNKFKEPVECPQGVVDDGKCWLYLSAALLVLTT
jgi:hypothetical protein